MFDPKILSEIAIEHQEAFKTLHAIEYRLNQRFTDLEEPIRALVLSVASGEPLLLIGPPGTGKSRLIRALCVMIGLLKEEDLNIELLSEKEQNENHPDYFEYLLTPFTEPGELFGFYNILKATNEGILERFEKNVMQKARVVYLDEVFNGSSAILNSILTFLNERIFHDRGDRKKVAMQCLFAATNQVPETPELRAVFDRFILRCEVKNTQAKPEPIEKLLRVGWRETYGLRKRDGSNLDAPKPGVPYENLLDELAKFRRKVVDLTTNGYLGPQAGHPFYKRLALLVQHTRQYNLSDISNRRLVKMTHIMLVHRVYEAVIEGELDTEISLGSAELELLPRYFLDRIDEEVVLKMVRAASHAIE